MAAIPAEIESWRNPLVLLNRRTVNAGLCSVGSAAANVDVQATITNESAKITLMWRDPELRFRLAAAGATIITKVIIAPNRSSAIALAQGDETQ